MSSEKPHTETIVSSAPRNSANHDDKEVSFDIGSKRSDGLPVTHHSEPFTLKLYVRECLWPGLGLFGESFLLFSIGILRPVLEMIFPECLVTLEECNESLIHGLTYGVVLGVISGMVIIGTLANSLGRRKGSIITASLMASSSILLVFCSFMFVSQTLFRSMLLCLFVFGIGVGGEYPLSASSASERAMGEMKRRNQLEYICPSESEDTPQRQNQTSRSLNPTVLRNHNRGKRILLMFTMQGLGIFCNTLFITLLLMLTNQYGDDGDLDGKNGNLSGMYDENALAFIWRFTYVVSSIVLTYVLVSRILYLEESNVWYEDQQNRILVLQPATLYQPPTNVIEEDRNEFSTPMGQDNIDSESSLPYLTLKYYGFRLFGTSMSWLLWDIAFYGNKLFQSKFLLALIGEDAQLLELTSAATLNSLIALLGYFAAAFLIDKPNVGRYKLQTWGFLITSILYIACGVLNEKLTPTILCLLYFASSFFGQCGPNATTFLIPAEIFPTEIRTMCHGVSAAFGKIGALLAAVLFNFSSDTDIFVISGYASLLAFAITSTTIPETTQLDLFELDKKWHLTCKGRRKEYVGAANSDDFLSYIEIQRS